MSGNIETPEGWERSGPCFTRVYGGKLAVLELDEVLSGAYPVVHRERGLHVEVGYLEFHDAVAWANDQLGVPKPVEVVEREFADGSVLVCDANQARSARVRPDGNGWDCDSNRWLFFPTNEQALEAARAYVRGDA